MCLGKQNKKKFKINDPRGFICFFYLVLWPELTSNGSANSYTNHDQA